MKHGALEFNVLLHERHALGFADLFDQTGGVLGNALDIFHEPGVGRLCDILVAVDFGLFVAPFGERGGVSPHGDFGGDVDELEV